MTLKNLCDGDEDEDENILSSNGCFLSTLLISISTICSQYGSNNCVQAIEPSLPVFSQLPEEILNHIFSYLTFDECKNVKLTCRLWNDCNFSKHVKFVFRGNCSVPQIEQILSNPYYEQQMNLEFHVLSVNCLPADVWKICGPRIYSVIFCDCHISEITFRNIILHCTNLESLEVHNNDNKKTNDALSMMGALNYFIERHIVRIQLHTFVKTMKQGRAIAVNELALIFSVFPGIKRFHTSLDGYIDYKLPSNLSSIQLEGRFVFPLHRGKVLQSPIPLYRRLSEFGVLFDCKYGSCPSKDAILHFFAVQKNLEIIKLELRSMPDVYLKQLMFHILENCSNLRKFSISIESDYNCSIDFNLSEIIHFIKLISNLECLSLDCSICFLDVQKLPEPLTLKLALYVLSLGSRTRRFTASTHVICYILQHCSNLKHLKFYNRSDEVLQQVFEYVPQLQTFDLTQYPTYEYDGLRSHGGGLSRRRSQIMCELIKKLQNLQELSRLKIRCYDLHLFNAITDKLTAFSFPNLKYLDVWLERINVDPEKGPCLESHDVYFLSSKLPRLETLIVKPYRPKNVEEIIKVIEPLKKLKHFGMSDMKLLELKYLFEKFPNLKYLSTPTKIFQSNTFTGEVCCTLNHGFGLYENDLFSVFKRYKIY